MPKIKRLIKYVYSNSKHKGSKSRLYNLLRQSYGYTYQYLTLEFKMTHADGDSLFIDAYKRMTLRDFDKLCSMMPRHEPTEILEMITIPQMNYGGILKIVEQLNNINKIKSWYKDKRADDLEKMLNNIIKASTFEKRQEAIEFAERKMNRLTFEI